MLIYNPHKVVQMEVIALVKLWWLIIACLYIRQQKTASGSSFQW